MVSKLHPQVYLEIKSYFKGGRSISPRGFQGFSSLFRRRGPVVRQNSTAEEHTAVQGILPRQSQESETGREQGQAHPLMKSEP